MGELSRDETILLEEYKSLRAEIQENLRTRSSILLYLVIIIASITAPSVTSGNLAATCLLLPLMFPLLIWWNSLYIANLAISHYIREIIASRLEPLRWESVAGKQRKTKLGLLLKIHTAPGMAVIYVIIGLSPSVYFAVMESTLEFIGLLILNILLGIVILYSTFRSPHLIRPAVEEITKVILEQREGMHS